MIEARTVPEAEPAASVVIVTKDRREDLRTALHSATTQVGGPEVIVMDDGSSDGTSEMVAIEFPAVRYIRAAASRGYIVQRNEAARMATTPLLVSIDDDACFSSPDAVATTVAEFDDPRIGAVAIPFIHTARGPEVLQRAPSDDGVWVTEAYIGTAHAVRRDLFLELGGYRESLEHFFEEPDFCIRMLRAGYVVRIGRAEPILHNESPRRNQARGITYLCRNHMLFAWFHVPFPHCVLRWVAVTGYAVWFGSRLRVPRAAVRGVIRGVGYILAHRDERDPVSVAVYRLWRGLRRRPARLESVVIRLDHARSAPASGGAAPSAGGRGADSVNSV